MTDHDKLAPPPGPAPTAAVVPDTAAAEPTDIPTEAIPGSSGKKKKGKSEKRKGQRALKPWERYRAATDAYDIAQDLLEFADRKVRFGLVVIGAVNVVIFGLAAKSGAAVAIPPLIRPWVMAFLAVYGVVLIAGVRYAISALRPRVQPVPARPDVPIGLHFFEDVLRRDLPAYERAWQEVEMETLTGLVACQTYSLAHINRSKFAALRHMYTAIGRMVVMAAGLLVLMAALLFLQEAGSTTPAAGSARAAAAAEPTSREYKLMLRPERFADAAGRTTPDSIRQAIRAYWTAVAAARFAGVTLHMQKVEERLATGPSKTRLLHFLEAAALPAEPDCTAGQAYFYDCKGLVLRSRVAVRARGPGQGFEVDPREAAPVEMTLKSRGPSAQALGAARRITAVGSFPVEYRAEKDMTVGRTTFGHSSTVSLTLAQAAALFKDRAADAPEIPLPADLRELRGLFSAPQLAGVENRALLAVADYTAYEEVWRLFGALQFADAAPATISLSFWFQPASLELRVVEVSWRLEGVRAGRDSLPPALVGSSEQFLDHVVQTSHEQGWYDPDAATKKAHALAAARQ